MVFRCACCVRCKTADAAACDDADVVADNCCGCNLSAYRQVDPRAKYKLATLISKYFSQVCALPDVRLVYITYHVDVGETPFLVAVDAKRKAIVIAIRGTLSLKVG